MSVQATQVGAVELQTKNGHVLPGFQNVIFAPNLRDNLVSVGRMCEGGHTVVFNACGSKVFVNKGLVIKGKEVHSEMRDKRTGLYPLSLYPPDRLALTAQTEDLIAMEDLQEIARAILERNRTRDLRPMTPAVKLPALADDETLANLSRVFVRTDLEEAQRWHEKCGHVSMKYLKRFTIPTLLGKKLPMTFRCESCIKGKIHRQPHKELHLEGKPTYAPGEYIITDLMGPYSNSIGGARYAQLFKDQGSGYLWLYTIRKKSGSDQSIVDTVIDAKARSGKALRFLKTDGDGIFRSESLADICKKYGFIHERSAPNDHNSNPEIEREIRTVFEGTATAMEASGAPSSFWAEAMHHFVFTRGVLPARPATVEGRTCFKSPSSILDPNARRFKMEYLVAFGTLVTCYLPVERRDGGKSPAQKRSFRGALVGYAQNMSAYKIWDLEKKKKREISFAFTYVHEGFFPFLKKEDWPSPPEEETVKFFPTREALLDKRELGIFDFDREELEDVLGSREIFTLTLSEDKHNEYPRNVLPPPSTFEKEISEMDFLDSDGPITGGTGKSPGPNFGKPTPNAISGTEKGPVVKIGSLKGAVEGSGGAAKTVQGFIQDLLKRPASERTQYEVKSTGDEKASRS